MQIMTVLGPIPAHEMGTAAPHEHLLCDASMWWRPPVEPSRRSVAYGPIELQNRGEIFRNQWINRDNMVLDDERLAVEEVTRFKAAGGRTVVDLTSHGIGRDPLALARISRVTGLNVVCGTGYYIEEVHPAEVRKQSADDIAFHFIREFRDGIGETGIRAGVIGEIGTSTRITAQEEKVLRAAARAQIELKCGVNVHIDIFGREAQRALAVLLDEGADPQRVAFSHWDHHDLDFDNQRAVLERGAFVEYDGFGREAYLDDIGHHWARDTERVAGISQLVAEGFADQLLVSSDICLKTDLRAYGGFGYDHILVSIIPMLRRAGLSADIIGKLLIANPASLLALPE